MARGCFLRGLWPNQRPLCRIRHMGDQKPMGFCIFYEHNCDRGVSFCNVMAKNPWLFAYLSITTATGVSVSAMRLRKTNGFLHISLYLVGCQKQILEISSFWSLQKAVLRHFWILAQNHCQNGLFSLRASHFSPWAEYLVFGASRRPF